MSCTWEVSSRAFELNLIRSVLLSRGNCVVGTTLRAYPRSVPINAHVAASADIGPQDYQRSVIFAQCENVRNGQDRLYGEAMSEAATGSLRARKKDATRRALSLTALNMALERGYDGFTIADVTESVGVSRRTFSNYFAGKAECIAGSIEGLVGGILDAAAAAASDLGFVDLLIELVANVDEETFLGFENFHQILAAAPEVQAQVYALDLQAATDAAAEIASLYQLDPTDVRVDLLTAIAMAAARTCIERWLNSGRAGGRAGLRTLLEQATSLLDRNAIEQLIHG